MDEKETIISNIKQQNDIAKGIEAVKIQRGLFRASKLAGLNKKLKALEDVNRKLIETFLEANNAEYKKLVTGNYVLLKKEPLTFKVYSEGYMFLGTYTTVMAGSVHDNGYAYCDAMESNFPLFRVFTEYQYPKKMAGKVDYWGRINLETVQTDMALLKRIPKILSGAVYDDGNIVLTTTERDYELFTGGRMCMSKMIANFFGDDEGIRTEFLDNCDKLRQMISVFKEEMTSPAAKA